MVRTGADLIEGVRALARSSVEPAALVFNCHITGLAVARSLGGRGTPVVGLDKDQRALGLASKYVSIAGLCPYPLEDEHAFIELLLEIGAALGRRAVLFPCLDEWVLAVARHRRELEPYFIFPFAEMEIVDRILDKSLLYPKCQDLGIPIPRTTEIEPGGAERIARQLSFPCIVKPARQREFVNEFGEKVFRAESPKDFLCLCERARDHLLLAQEIVDAGSDGFYSLCSYVDRQSRPLGVFVGRKREQYPRDFGTACLVDSRSVESIAERGLEILRKFDYHGISEVEFILDPRDGEYKLLDVNTRVWKWIGLPVAAGVDLPWMAYRDGLNLAVDAAANQVDGINWVYTRDYLRLERERAGREGSITAGDVWAAVAESRANGMVDAVFSEDDPAPGESLIMSLADRGEFYCAC